MQYQNYLHIKKWLLKSLKGIFFPALVLITVASPLSTLKSQNTAFRGINYQAVARNVYGQILTDQEIFFKATFASKTAENKNFYTEIHRLKTNEFGLFKIIIGQGDVLAGALEEIPWAKSEIWLDLELGTNEFARVNVKSSVKLQTVPFAYHAETTEAISENEQVDLRNQSIYWLTSGNSRTVPPYHFLGTLDESELIFKTDSTTRMILTKDGQLQMYSGVSGDQKDPGSYPLTIEGGNQGIYIKVNGERNTNNHFVTFGDEVKSMMWGRIEGQTTAELRNDANFKVEQTLFDISVVSLLANAIGVGIQVAGEIAAAGSAGASLFFSWQVPGWVGAAAGSALDVVAVGIEVADLILNSELLTLQLFTCIGVSYQSGSGDYAESLLRDSLVRDLLPGEIVGLKSGKITLDTDDAEHTMVISTAPIVLGNMPEGGETPNHERIAFLGQVPARVAGAVQVGDYIIPSGNHDGLGVAIHPDKMKIADYKKIVGVAWEAAADAPLNEILISVGLNQNDLAPVVEELSTKVDNIIAFLNGEGSLRPEGTNTSTSANHKQHGLQQQSIAPAAINTNIKDFILTDDAFDDLIDENAAHINDIFVHARARLLEAGYNPDQSELAKALFSNPVKRIKELRRDPTLYGKWGRIDQKLIENSKN